jgi:radical SAM protein with 4Fe4S-binding SPASM domain
MTNAVIERVTSWRRHLGFYRRHPRHLKTLLRHGTPRKVANVVLAESERLLRVTNVRSRPYYYWMDICNFCNLRCPLCDTGRQQLLRQQSMMTFDDFTRLFAKIEPYALEVCLYNWGEPFLNRDVFRIIEHVSKHNVGSNLSTNFSLVLSDEQLESIVRSGLEHLIVSLDGTTQEVYEMYRRRGKFERVVDNVRRLLAVRKRLNATTPAIEWQFIVFKHNEQQRDDARRMAKEIGFDSLRFASPAMPYVDMFSLELAEQFMPENRDFWQYNPALIQEKDYIDDQVCHYLYRTAAINADGGVTPCCFLHNEKHDFGDLKFETVNDIWNNSKYRSARSLFSRKPQKGLKGTACNACPLFKQPNNRHEQRRIARARIEKLRSGAPRAAEEERIPLVAPP